MLKAARQAGARDVVAVVQPHRYTRLQSLFNEFCTCMNDAGTVIVADVYAAGEAPIAGVTRDALVEGLRARGHRSVVPLPTPGASGGDGARDRPAGRFRRLPRCRQRSRNGPPRCRRNWPRCRRAPRRGKCGMMTAASHSGLLRDRCPPLRGRIAGECAAGAVHLVPRRRPRGGAGAAGRCGGPCATSCAPCRTKMPVHVIGACSNLIVRDGGLPGVTIRLARGFSTITRRTGRHRRRRRRAGCHGGGTCRRRRAHRPGISVRHSRHHRRRGGDERRRLRRRHRVLPRLGRDRYAHWRATPPVRRRSGVRLSPCAPAAWRRGRSRPAACATPAPPPRSRARMAEIRATREASQPVRARTGGSTFRNPAGHEGMGTDRRRRLSRPDPRRRAGVREALQLPDQHRHGARRPTWKVWARKCAAACSPRPV